MAEKAHSDGGVKHQRVKTITWTGLVGADTGDAVKLAEYSDKTVQVIGPTFDGAVTIQGSNDGTNYETLTDLQGNALSFIAKGMKLIAENPKYIKCAVAAGTSVNTIILTCTKS